MALYETEAILLAVKDWGDADRMVTLFSSDYGKITAVAYGARMPRNRLSGPLQAFSQVMVTLSQGKQLDYIKQCHVQNSFKEIREDIVTMAYSLFVAEIVLELWPEREADIRVFELLSQVFQLISVRNQRIVALAAAWRLLSLAGYQPLHDYCISCDSKLSFPAYFSLEPCGALCQNCAGSDHMEYTEDMFNFICQLSQFDWLNPGHFTTTKRTLLLTERLVYDMLTYLTGKPLKSVSFIDAVQG